MAICLKSVKTKQPEKKTRPNDALQKWLRSAITAWSVVTSRRKFRPSVLHLRLSFAFSTRSLEQPPKVSEKPR